MGEPVVTLTHLCALLERALTHATNPAILRLPEGERTVEGLIIAYLGEEVWTIMEWADVDDVRATISAMAWRSRSVPFRSRALLVALTLALGLDPGVGGLHPCWTRDEDRGWWTLWSGPGSLDIRDFTPRTHPTVAAEPDPLKALVLAVLHLLEAAHA